MLSVTFVQIVSFLLVTGFIICAGLLVSRRDRLIEQRLRGLLSDKPAAIGSAESLEKDSLLLRLVDNLIRFDASDTLHLQSRFLEAGVYRPWATSVYIVGSCILAIAFAGIALLTAPCGFLHWKYAVLAAAASAIIGAGLPHLWLERRRAARHLVLRRAMPDFLDLVVACLTGGLSVQASLRQVADELKLAHPELSGELSLTLRDLELGSTLDRALQQMATRTGVEEMKTLRSFIQQTLKFGTTITDALGQMSEMLRIQREQRAEELAQKAAVKILFPTMIFIFPTVFVVLAGPAAVQIQEGLMSNGQYASSIRK